MSSCLCCLCLLFRGVPYITELYCIDFCWQSLVLLAPAQPNQTTHIKNERENLRFHCNIWFRSEFFLNDLVCVLPLLLSLFSLKSWWRLTHPLSTFLKWARRPLFDVKNKSHASMLFSRFVWVWLICGFTQRWSFKEMQRGKKRKKPVNYLTQFQSSSTNYILVDQHIV